MEKAGIAAKATNDGAAFHTVHVLFLIQQAVEDPSGDKVLGRLQLGIQGYKDTIYKNTKIQQ